MSTLRIWENHRFYKPPFEGIYLGMPLLFIVIAIMELLGFSSLNTMEIDDLRLIVAITFLNSLHILFTYYLVIHVPVYNKLLHSSKVKNRILLLVAMVVFLKWIEIFFLGPLSVFAKYIFLFAALFHVGMQFFGMSQLYNFKLQCKNSSHGEYLPKRKTELFLIQVFMAVTFIYLLIFRFTHLGLPVLELSIVCNLIFAIIFLKLLFLYKKNLRYLTLKSVFWSRILLLPLGVTSNYAMLALGIIHGTEYLLICSRVEPHIRVKIKKGRGPQAIARLLIFTFLFTLIANSVLKRYTIVPPSDTLRATINIIATVMLLLHYYFDRLIFGSSTREIKQLKSDWSLDKEGLSVV